MLTTKQIEDKRQEIKIILRRIDNLDTEGAEYYKAHLYRLLREYDKEHFKAILREVTNNA